MRTAQPGCRPATVMPTAYLPGVGSRQYMCVRVCVCVCVCVCVSQAMLETHTATQESLEMLGKALITPDQLRTQLMVRDTLNTHRT